MKYLVENLLVENVMKGIQKYSKHMKLLIDLFGKLEVKKLKTEIEVILDRFEPP